MAVNQRGRVVANEIFEEIEVIEEALTERCVELCMIKASPSQGTHQLPLVAPGGMIFQELFNRIRYYWA